MQSTIRQRRHLEYKFSLRHAEPMKVDERVGDVVTKSQGAAAAIRQYVEN